MIQETSSVPFLEQINIIGQIVVELSEVDPKVGVREFKLIDEKIRFLLEDIDFTVPGAQETLRGRVKELIPPCFSLVKQVLSAPQYEPIIEKVILAVKRFAPSLAGLLYSTVLEGPPQIPTSLEQLVLYPAAREAYAFNRFARRNGFTLPSTWKEIELEFRFFQVACTWTEQALVAAKKGVEEKQQPSADDLRIVEDIRQRHEDLTTQLEIFKNFMVKEKAQAASSGEKPSVFSELDVPSMLAAWEAHKALHEPYSKIAKDLMPALVRLTFMPLPFESLSEFTRTLESDYVEADRLLEQPASIEKFRIVKAVSTKVVESIITSEEHKLGDIPKGISERYSSEELFSVALVNVLISLVPEISSQLKPVLLQLGSKHISCCELFFNREMMEKMLRKTVDVEPQSELARKYKELCLQMADQLAPLPAKKKKS